MLHDSQAKLLSASRDKDLDMSSSIYRSIPFSAKKKKDDEKRHETFLAQMKARHVVET